MDAANGSDIERLQRYSGSICAYGLGRPLARIRRRRRGRILSYIIDIFSRACLSWPRWKIVRQVNDNYSRA